MRNPFGVTASIHKFRCSDIYFLASCEMNFKELTAWLDARKVYHITLDGQGNEVGGVMRGFERNLDDIMFCDFQTIELVKKTKNYVVYKEKGDWLHYYFTEEYGKKMGVLV